MKILQIAKPKLDNKVTLNDTFDIVQVPLRAAAESKSHFLMLRR